MSKKKLERMSIRNTLIVLGMGVGLTSQMMSEASKFKAESQDLAGKQDKDGAGSMTGHQSGNLEIYNKLDLNGHHLAWGHDNNTGKDRLLVSKDKNNWKDISLPGGRFFIDNVSCFDNQCVVQGYDTTDDKHKLLVSTDLSSNSWKDISLPGNLSVGDVFRFNDLYVVEGHNIIINDIDGAYYQHQYEQAVCESSPER